MRSTTELAVGSAEATSVFNAIYEAQKIKGFYRYGALSQAARGEFADFRDFNQVYREYIQPDTNDVPGDALLVRSHAFFLSRESFLLVPSIDRGITEATRVFPPKDTNILTDVDDLFRNGLAFFRAATTI